MGSAKLPLTSLELNRAEDMTIKLEDAQRPLKDLGEIKLNVTLWPKTQEDKEQVSLWNAVNPESIISTVFSASYSPLHSSFAFSWVHVSFYFPLFLF